MVLDAELKTHDMLRHDVHDDHVLERQTTADNAALPRKKAASDRQLHPDHHHIWEQVWKKVF